MRHIISVLLENEPGALSRVVGLFSQRNYNIDSLSVAPTEDRSLSRLTLTTSGDDARIEQITKHLNRIVDVVKLADLTEGDHIERELMLIKVKASAAAAPAAKTEAEAEMIERLAADFGGEIVDRSGGTMTAQLIGTSEELDAFIAGLKGQTVLEVARSGVSGIARGDKHLAV